MSEDKTSFCVAWGPLQEDEHTHHDCPVIARSAQGGDGPDPEQGALDAKTNPHTTPEVQHQPALPLAAIVKAAKKWFPQYACLTVLPEHVGPLDDVGLRADADGRLHISGTDLCVSFDDEQEGLFIFQRADSSLPLVDIEVDGPVRKYLRRAAGTAYWKADQAAPAVLWGVLGPNEEARDYGWSVGLSYVGADLTYHEEGLSIGMKRRLCPLGFVHAAKERQAQQEIQRQSAQQPHPTEIEGWDGSLEDLAKAVEGLRYDKTAEFLGHLTVAFADRAVQDLVAERKKLAGLLSMAASSLQGATAACKAAWNICAPHMKR